MKPITPDDVSLQKRLTLPDEVIDSFNKMIAQNWAGKASTFKQSDVVVLIKMSMGLTDDNIIYEKHWLDIEDTFRNVGWKVEYDKPAYNEFYPATFTFSRK